VTTLADLNLGQRARVSKVVGDDDLSLRLLEMGLTPDVEVVLLGRAPLGDPLDFEVRGYRLSLRRQEAALVEINAVESAEK